jgi:hypothetical protein
VFYSSDVNSDPEDEKESSEAHEHRCDQRNLEKIAVIYFINELSSAREHMNSNNNNAT